MYRRHPCVPHRYRIYQRHARVYPIASKCIRDTLVSLIAVASIRDTLLYLTYLYLSDTQQMYQRHACVTHRYRIYLSETRLCISHTCSYHMLHLTYM